MARKQGSHAQITGPRVHAAATKLIARHGFAAVSMRQIAAEVGMQAGALYNYTDDKQSLLRDLLRDHMEELIAAVDLALPPSTAMARLEAFTRFHLEFNLQRADRVFLSYMELRNLSPENFAMIEAMRRDYENRLEAILQQGEAEGTMAVPDTRVTTLALIAQLTGVINWYRAGGRLDQPQIAAIYWELVRKSVSVVA